MSLFSSIQSSSNALRVNQLGLEVVSNNIANANTPGYIRQELVQAPAAGIRVGSSIVGQGVVSIGITQKVDEFLVQRMRDVQSQLSQAEGLSSTNSLIESSLQELGDKDLSSSMSKFSNAMQDLANQPGSNALRTLAIQRGTELAGNLKSIHAKISDIAASADSEVTTAAQNINRLTESIANLNQRIVEVEGGSITTSDAVGLRDERIKALEELSTYVDIKVNEQDSGAVTVIVGGDYLVTDGLSRKVKAPIVTNEDGSSNRQVLLVDTDAPLNASAGKLKGLYDSRDSASQTFLAKLDTLAANIIHDVNRIHSQGQGAKGLTQVLGEPIIKSATQPIEQAGDQLQIDNGSFVIQVKDTSTGKIQSYNIDVQQQGLSNDTSVNDLITQINQISGIQASLTADGRFQIKSNSAAIQFSFANDTSGALAGLGLNTFFQGNSASTISVKDEILKDPSRLAIALDGPGNGNRNAVALAEVFKRASPSLNGASLSDSYSQLIASTTQGITEQQSITDGLRNFYQTLESNHLGISGVSLDEEGIKMLLYQRAFQASSRVISTANDLLKTLVELV